MLRSVVLILLVFAGRWASSEVFIAPDTLKTFVVPSVYAGLSNQRLCFLLAALYGWKNNAAVVLPHWKFEFDNHEGAVLVDFSYLFTINEGRQQEIDAIRDVVFVRELPVDRIPVCLAQLQSGEYHEDPFVYWLEPLMKRFDGRPGVVCLSSHGTFYGLSLMLQKQLGLKTFQDVPFHQVMQSFRSLLVVNPLFTNISTAIVSRLAAAVGTTDFVAVHARVEEDFQRACRKWPRKKLLGDEHYSTCYETDEWIAGFVASAAVANNSVLLIANGQSEDLAFAGLPTLCNRACTGSETQPCLVFRCVRKEGLLPPEELHNLFPSLLPGPSSMAMIDHQLALHASLFIGNHYSTMSVEIVFDRLLDQQQHRGSLFYNRPCVGYPDQPEVEC